MSLFTSFAIPANAANIVSKDSIEKAIAYAYDTMNTRPSYFSGYCAAFVWRCYYSGANIRNSSYATAREMGDALITNTDANPPRGAFVFWYDSNGPYSKAGHVALSLGDGNVIHAYSRVKVTSIDTVNNSHYTYRGWGAPKVGYTLETASSNVQQSAPAATPVSSSTAVTSTAQQMISTAKNTIGQQASYFGFSNNWCAQFVGWCAKQVGITNLVGTRCAYPSDFAEYVLNNNTGSVYYFRDTHSSTYDKVGNYLRSNCSNTSNMHAMQRSNFAPQPGDFICFLWKNSAERYTWSHIGIVSAVDGAKVYYYEGNSGGSWSNSQVKSSSVSRTDLAITCYIRPNYSGTAGNNAAPAVIEQNSTLAINMTSYPSSINVGSSYGLRGTVSSNYTIKQVNGYIINSSGNTVMSTTDYPNSYSMDVRYANLNNNLVFNRLGAGTYTLKIVATDSKISRTWTANFTVKGSTSSSNSGGSSSGSTQTNTRVGIINIPSSWTSLTLRNGPGTSYKAIAEMPQGARVTVYPDKASSGWYYVNYNGTQGYASGRQIVLQ